MMIDEIQEMTPAGMARRTVCLVVKPSEATMMELNEMIPAQEDHSQLKSTGHQKRSRRSEM